ncbi:MAG: LLM class flavin-dependent oxidoreductase [Acidimicrobiia bacterium]|nr:LLM class flavin-dependent oxidoreductase [Acidimicrobiia bacterium]
MTLPSFVEDPGIPLEVADAAEDSGLDAVFAFDHLFGEGPAGRRPALDCFALLGAVAAETESLALGPLVARATLRKPAVLAGELDTLHRVSEGRVIAAIGGGDRRSQREDDEYGVRVDSVSHRVGALLSSVRATRDRGYPVWVGGRASSLGTVIAQADGWNRWGGTPADFAGDAALLHRSASVGATLTWGGLAVVGATDGDAERKAESLSAPPGAIVGGPRSVAQQLRAYADAGAEWVIVAPVDSSEVSNAGLLGEVASYLRRG